MNRTVVVLVGVVAALVLWPVAGFASNLSPGSKTLGASSASVSRCDTDGVGVIQNLSGSNVVSVTVSGIASACAGAVLSATVDNGSTFSTGSAIVPAGGGTVTVTLASAVAAATAERTDVAISGP
jgi:hypothetical protein